MDDAEDGRVGADAERQRQDGHGGEARRPAQHPRGVVQIPPGIIQPAQGSFVAVPLLHLLDAAERALRGESGIVGRQAAASKLVFEQRQVGRDFSGELAVRGAVAEDVGQPREQAA